jgi:hypothetical protein
MITSESTKGHDLGTYDRGGHIVLRLGTAMGPPTKTAALLGAREQPGALASSSGEGPPSPDPGLVLAVVDAARIVPNEERSENL